MVAISILFIFISCMDSSCLLIWFMIFLRYFRCCCFHYIGVYVFLSRFRLLSVVFVANRCEDVFIIISFFYHLRSSLLPFVLFTSFISSVLLFRYYRIIMLSFSKIIGHTIFVWYDFV